MIYGNQGYDHISRNVSLHSSYSIWYRIDLILTNAKLAMVDIEICFKITGCVTFVRI